MTIGIIRLKKTNGLSEPKDTIDFVAGLVIGYLFFIKKTMLYEQFKEKNGNKLNFTHGQTDSLSQWFSSLITALC